jgi:phosphatidylglycerophosphate synthase
MGLLSVLSIVMAMPFEKGVLLLTIGSFSFFSLPIYIIKERMQVADIISLARPVGGLLVVFLLMLRSTDASGYGVFVILVSAALTDLIDGKVARSGGNGAGSRWGGIIDAESDGFFTFILCYAGYVFLGFGVWVLMLGIMRYVFGLLFLMGPLNVDRQEIRFPAYFTWTAKTVHVVTVCSLITLYAPFVGYTFKTTVLIVAGILLTGSFLLETWLRLGLVRSYAQD